MLHLVALPLVLCCAGALPGQRAVVDRIDAQLPATTGQQRLELLWRRTIGLRATHVPTARDAAAAFAAEARSQSRTDYEGLALLLQSGCEIALAHGSVAATLRQQALALPDAADARLAGHRELALCQADCRAFAFGNAVRHLQAARTKAEACGDDALRAGCQLAFLELLKVTDLRADATDIDAAVAAIHAAGDPPGLDATRYRLEAAIQGGRDREADEFATAALARAQTTGDALLDWSVNSCLLWRAWQQNRFDDAIAAAERGEQAARRLESTELLAAALDGRAWSMLLAGRPDGTGELVDQALELAATTGLPMLELRILDSAVSQAIARHDKDALLRHAVRRQEIVASTGGPDTAADREFASTELRRMLGERRDHDASSLRDQERSAGNRQLTILLGSTAAVAMCGVLFVAKRRVERVHRRLLSETDRARASEAARARLQEQLHHLERLDSIGLLAAGIAHDFNNILTSIQGNAELLHHAGSARDQHVAAILTGTSRAAALCRKLLDHAEPRLGDRRVHDLSQLTAAMRPLLDAISARAIAVELDLAPTPVLAAVDRAGIEQVLLNLCANAVEASPPGDRVRIRVRRADAGEVARATGTWFGKPPLGDAFAVVEVVDSGRGIPPEQLHRVFDPFFTTRFEGRGLGLSVAFGIVTALGGAFCVDSQPGRGSRFAIFLPNAGSEAPTHDEAAPTTPETAGLPRTVLVVDDDEAVRNWLERALRQRGCTVLLAADGRNAVQQFAAHPDATVLLDVNMPDRDGPSVLGDLRRIRADLRVVVISGLAAAFVREQFPAERELTVLQKPFRAAELLRAIARSA